MSVWVCIISILKNNGSRGSVSLYSPSQHVTTWSHVPLSFDFDITRWIHTVHPILTDPKRPRSTQPIKLIRITWDLVSPTGINRSWNRTPLVPSIYHRTSLSAYSFHQHPVPKSSSDSFNRPEIDPGVLT